MSWGVRVQADGRQAGSTTFGEDAFRALYPALRRLASVVADPDVDPDDLVQDALAGLLRQRLDDIDDPAAYLRRSIVNGVLQHRRTAGRRKAMRRQEPSQEHVDVDYPTHVRAVLDAVPPRDRALLYLLHIEGRTVVEVSRTLGLSEATVKQRALRARQRARHALIEQEERS